MSRVWGWIFVGLGVATMLTGAVVDLAATSAGNAFAGLVTLFVGVGVFLVAAHVAIDPR